MSGGWLDQSNPVRDWNHSSIVVRGGSAATVPGYEQDFLCLSVFGCNQSPFNCQSSPITYFSLPPLVYEHPVTQSQSGHLSYLQLNIYFGPKEHFSSLLKSRCWGGGPFSNFLLHRISWSRVSDHWLSVTGLTELQCFWLLSLAGRWCHQEPWWLQPSMPPGSLQSDLHLISVPAEPHWAVSVSDMWANLFLCVTLVCSLILYV